jgi:hypothetical protein
MNFSVLESIVLGVVTLVLFLYGFAQRHLRKKVLQNIETEKMKVENQLYEAELASKGNLLKIERDREIAETELKSLRETCQGLAGQRDDLMKEVAEIQGQKKDLLNFMGTEDGRVKLKEAEEKLALLNKELNARKSGRVVCMFAYTGKTSCKNAYDAILEECENLWKCHPDLVLSMHTRGTSQKSWFCDWQGTSPTSFRAQRKAKETHTWNEDGHCELRVV